MSAFPRLLVLLGLLATAGCQPRQGRVSPHVRELARTDFDHFRGWVPQLVPTLTTEKAHSGRYAIRVDQAHPFSPTFRAPLGQLVGHRPRRLTLGAWVWVAAARDDASLLLAINNPADPENPVLRKEVFLNDAGPFGEWKWVSRDIDLPLNLVFSSDNQLVIYLLAKDCAAPVYADDLRLTELW